MRPIAIASVVLALAAGPAAAQTAGQPLVTVKPKAASAKPPNPAKPPHVAKPASTPEGRSAAALALSAEPVFDEGTYQRLKEALLSYSAIQVRGGWPSLAADAQLAPGGSGPSVALLRRRLAITEDLGAERRPATAYDAAVGEAVKRFQLRHGLEPTGSVNAPTLRALNVPVAARIKQLEASLERLLGMDFIFAERYVVVNIPAAFVEAVAHDKVERRYRVIVGKVDKPSPTLTAYITAINLNPTWTVPLSITKNEIFARMRKRPELYQPHAHARARRRTTKRSARKQSTGRRTARPTSPSARIPATGTRSAISRSICRIRIRCTCTTPMTRNLFANDYRFDSHGCTRVDNVRDLAAWILDDVPGWNRAAIDAGIAAGVLKVINLPRRMPVAWVYLTGWMTRDGTINFREDVYKHDEALDRDALADAAAGGFVVPLRRDVKQVSNLDSR